MLKLSETNDNDMGRGSESIFVFPYEKLLLLQDVCAQSWFLESVSSLKVVDHLVVGQCWVGEPSQTEHLPTDNSIGPL